MVLLYILPLPSFLHARIVDLFFIKSSDKISKDLKFSRDTASSTLIAVDSSAHKLFVARQGRSEMVESNVSGTNFFDILVGLSLPFLIFMLINEKSVSSGNSYFLYPVFILFSSMQVMFLLLILTKWRIGKTTGFFLLLLYLLYLVREIIILYI